DVGVLPSGTGRLPPQAQVPPARQVWHEGGLLDEGAHVAERVVAGPNGRAQHDGGAGGGTHEPEHHAEQGRLPRAVGPQDVADLLEHTGAVHRWVTAMVRDLATERLLRADLELGLPDDPAQLAGWLGAGATPLVETLRVADPDAPMWAWGADHHVRFWSRRM